MPTHDTQPFVLPIENTTAYQGLLPGPPATCGMKSGCVTLAEGAECGWHSTEGYEETLVVLEGRGRGQTRDAAESQFDFEAPCVVYMPPQTEHNMVSLGPGPLRYVYTVAPAGPKAR